MNQEDKLKAVMDHFSAAWSDDEHPDELLSLAILNLRPTIAETLIAIEPFVPVDMALSFTLHVWDRMIEKGISDKERSQMVGLFANILPRVAQDKYESTSAIADVKDFILNRLYDGHCDRDSFPFVEKAVAILNMHLAEPVDTAPLRPGSERPSLRPKGTTLH